MTIKSRTPRPPEPPKKPARKKAPRTNIKHGNTTLMREKFVLEYLVDRNGTQAAIRAGASPHSAHATASRWLRRDDVRELVAQHERRVLAPLMDQYEATGPRIIRELALLGFANISDMGAIDADGQFVIDLSEANRDHMAALHSVKARRTTRTIGDVEIVERTTEIRMADKRAALMDLARIQGLLKEDGAITVPVRFFINWGPGPKPEPYPDEEAA